jgi:hypothetical protein
MHRILLLVALIGLAGRVAAADPTYDILIVACKSNACEQIREQAISTGVAAEFNRNGLRLSIETLGRREDEEDTRVSLNVGAAQNSGGVWHATAASLAQRVETMIVRCTLKHLIFSPLTSFVSDGTSYQIWARLAAIP